MAPSQACTARETMNPVIRVALVDDDRALCATMAAFLNATPGFSCIATYGSTAAALEGIPRNPPDVVLMDINMPGRDGIACVQQLKQILPDVQVVMLTVYEDADRIFAALAAGATGYLLKRVTPDKLLEAIREVHEGGSPMSSSIARKVVASFRQTAPRCPSHPALSPREQAVLEGLARGLTYKQIADQLQISIETIRTYIRRIYEKLHVQSRTEAVAKYLRS